MVAPLRGPFTKSTVIKGPPNSGGFKPDWLYKDMVWHRQGKPYTEPSPYSMELVVVLSSSNTWNYSQSASDIPPHLTQSSQRLYNQAWSNFANEVRGVTASLGATLGEHKSSLSMISMRASQLFEGFKAAKRGDVSGVKRAWGKHAGLRPRLKAGAGHVLEYSFGWAPLVKDIVSSVQALSQGAPAFRVSKGAKQQLRRSLPQNLGSIVGTREVSTTLSWKLRAEIAVTNGNLLRANQLGLTNLASVAWELVPNSYIIDYFFNVSDYIGSWTAFDGLSLVRSSRTLLITTDIVESLRWKPGFGAPWNPATWSGKRVSMARSVGIPGPTLDLRPPWNMSVSRASTSIARLLQLLKGK